MKTRRDKFDVEWRHAHAKWRASKAGQPVSSPPVYNVWEIDESGREKLARREIGVSMTVRPNEAWSFA